MKNEEPLRLDVPHKYSIIGNGTELRLHKIGYADTGAYMCQAANVGGITRDISSLIVQEVPTPSENSSLAKPLLGRLPAQHYDFNNIML